MTAVGHDDVMDAKLIRTIGEHRVCATLARYGWPPAEGTNWPLATKAQFLAKSAYKRFVRVFLPGIPAIPGAFVVPRDHPSAAAWIGYQHLARMAGSWSGK